MAVLTDGVGAQDLLVRQNSTLVFMAGEKECYTDIRFLAIGGGGGTTRWLYPTRYGGAGSGYLDQCTVRMVSNNTDALVVAVGGGGSNDEDGGSSKVEVGEEVLVEAAGGKTGSGGSGGDGYSGGGAYGGGLGGMDGGDGEDRGSYRGGHGSGQDLEMMVMEHFVLTAGIGGNATGGGGGGGGLVNGFGPDPGLGVGQGYGGGGSQSTNSNTGGNDGCVLYEFI